MCIRDRRQPQPSQRNVHRNQHSGGGDEVSFPICRADQRIHYPNQLRCGPLDGARTTMTSASFIATGAALATGAGAAVTASTIYLHITATNGGALTVSVILN